MEDPRESAFESYEKTSAGIVLAAIAALCLAAKSCVDMTMDISRHGKPSAPVSAPQKTP